MWQTKCSIPKIILSNPRANTTAGSVARAVMKEMIQEDEGVDSSRVGYDELYTCRCDGYGGMNIAG